MKATWVATMASFLDLHTQAAFLWQTDLHIAAATSLRMGSFTVPEPTAISQPAFEQLAPTIASQESCYS